MTLGRASTRSSWKSNCRCCLKISRKISWHTVVARVVAKAHVPAGEPVPDSDVYASNGRGVLFMRALADSVDFERGEAGGTCVRLAKRRPMTAQAAGA